MVDVDCVQTMLLGVGVGLCGRWVLRLRVVMVVVDMYMVVVVLVVVKSGVLQ